MKQKLTRSFRNVEPLKLFFWLKGKEARDVGRRHAPANLLILDLSGLVNEKEMIMPALLVPAIILGVPVLVGGYYVIHVIK
jgi:hypothetical protein